MAIHSAGRRFNGLDLLRAFAIFFVFLYHYGYIFPHPEWVQTIGKFGWTGVDLFFVLSGYLIATQLFQTIGNNEKISFRDFFIKRFFRIIPPYGIVVAAYFLAPAIRERETIAPLWKFLTFTQNFGLDLRFQPAFSHAWSLCIEEQFYLLLPIILSALVYFKVIKNGVSILLVLFIGGFAARLFCWFHLALPSIHTDEFGVYWHTWIYYPTFCRLDGLLSGVAVAALFRFKPAWAQLLSKYGNELLLLSVAMLTSAYFLCLNEDSFQASIFGFPLVDISYGVMVLGAVCPSGFLYDTRSKKIVTVATYSYTIYLTHKIIIHAVQDGFEKIGISKETNFVFISCIAACLMMGLIMNKLVENPALRLRKKILEKHRSVPAAVHDR